MCRTGACLGPGEDEAMQSQAAEQSHFTDLQGPQESHGGHTGHLILTDLLVA